MQPLCSHWICDDGREGALGDVSQRFPYWSFSKTVLAVCALKLAETGRLDLDAALPEAPYTLRQLLSHTAGLPDYGSLAAYHAAVAADETPWPRERLLDLALAQGRLFAPGEGWAYSNIGYLLAREHIEAAADRGFGTLFREMIGTPLGLGSVELAESRAQFARTSCKSAQRYDPGWVYHGCLTGTPADAARLLAALVSGALLAPSSLAQLCDTYPLGGALEGRPWSKCGYGLGLMSGAMGAAGRALGHSGAGPGCVAAIYHFPDRPNPVTVASFADGPAEAVPEFETARLAVSV